MMFNVLFFFFFFFFFWGGEGERGVFYNYQARITFCPTTCMQLKRHTLGLLYIIHSLVALYLSCYRLITKLWLFFVIYTWGKLLFLRLRNLLNIVYLGDCDDDCPVVLYATFFRNGYNIQLEWRYEDLV